MKTSLIAIAALLTAAAPAAAQDFGFMTDAIASDIMHDSVFRERPGPRPGPGGKASAGHSAGIQPGLSNPSLFAALSATTPGQAPAAMSFSYTPSKGVSEKVERELLSRIKASNAEAGRIVAQQFSRHDPVKVYGDVAGHYGVPTRDLAATMGAYNVLAWLIANGHEEPPQGALDSVRQQSAAVMAQDPQMFSGDRLQLLDEEFMRLFVLMYASWDSAMNREGAGALATFSNDVNNMWKSMFGKDLRTMELTSAGFRDRG